MKNLLTLIVIMLLSVTASFAQTQSVVVKPQQEILKVAGVHMEKAGKTYTQSKVIGVVGGIVGGAITAIGVTNGNVEMTQIGGVVSGGSFLTAFIMGFVGDSHLKKGGRALKDNGYSINTVSINDTSPVERY
jgi:hypothetical protein